MRNALVQQDSPERSLPGTDETALRQVLEAARLLAVQTRLLALNTAFESAASLGVESEAVSEILGREASRSAAEAARVCGAVEQILQQIRTSAALAKPL